MLLSAPYVWRLPSAAASGKEIDVDRYGMMTDRIGRAFQRLGLKRTAKDVTPSLDDYLQQRRLDIEKENNCVCCSGKRAAAGTAFRFRIGIG